MFSFLFALLCTETRKCPPCFHRGNEKVKLIPQLQIRSQILFPECLFVCSGIHCTVCGVCDTGDIHYFYQVRLWISFFPSSTPLQHDMQLWCSLSTDSPYAPNDCLKVAPLLTVTVFISFNVPSSATCSQKFLFISFLVKWMPALKKLSLRHYCWS